MLKRIMTLLAAVTLVIGLAAPAASRADTTMYVYTENGKNLNVRSDPWTGDNIIGTLPFGEEVYVAYHLGNGWTALNWIGGSQAYVYVQTRFLVYEKPSHKPTPSGGGSSSGSGLKELNTIFKTYRYVEEPYQVTVRPTRASGWVNMRFAPSKEAELISTHRANEKMIVIAEFKGWYQVQDPETGEVGFISDQFVMK